MRTAHLPIPDVIALDDPFPRGGSADGRFCTRFRRRSGAQGRPWAERLRDASVAPALERGGEVTDGAREFAARGARRRSRPALRDIALVRDLNFDLKRLQKEHEDGSRGTRTARSYVLAQIAHTLHELGFRGLWVTGLRRKHVVALVRKWKRRGRSIGTMNPSCPVPREFPGCVQPSSARFAPQARTRAHHRRRGGRRPRAPRPAEAPALRARPPEDPQHQDPAPGVKAVVTGGDPGDLAALPNPEATEGLRRVAGER